MTACTCGAIPVEGMTRHRPDCALNRRDMGGPDLRPSMEVPNETIGGAIVCGLIKPIGNGEYELTEKGEAYFREWTKKRLAAASDADLDR